MTTSHQFVRALARRPLSQLVWRWRRARRRGGSAFILMYHRIADEADEAGLCVPPAMFDRQVSMLQQRARILPLAELVACLEDSSPLREDIAAITFDDGYRDNCDIALPILRAHNVPATVFVATAFVDGSVRPLGPRLRSVFTTLWAQDTPAHAWAPLAAGIDDAVRAALKSPGSLAAVRVLHTRLKSRLQSEIDAILGVLEQMCVALPAADGRMLDWDGVRTLARAGIEIASHTVSHPILSRVSLERAADELAQSKQRLEAEVGVPVRGFAYPNGHRADFTEAHVALLRRLGYGYACTAERGSNRAAGDPFRLRRIGVGRDSQALLDLKLALAEPQPCAA